MLILRSLTGSSLIALMAGAAVAQVTTVGNNRSEVQDSGRDNKALVEQATQDSDRNTSLVVFTGNGNRATVSQVGYDNASTARHQGDRNTSAVRQLGFRNSATLLQAGNENQSSIDQYVDPGFGRFGPRTAQVEQRGSRNSSIVAQALWDNVATVRQGTTEARSDGGVSTIYQYSAGNTASVTMTGGSADAANRSIVEQTRIDPVFTKSNAVVNIDGSVNFSYLFQSGVTNTASHSITGTQNTIVAKSSGNSLSSSVVQQGYRNFATLTQYAGDRNSSRIEQLDNSTIAPGGDRQVYVLQGGSDNSSTVSQRFTFNTVVVNQAGSGTASNVSQNGVGNFARANLLNGSREALNSSSIEQQWNSFFLDSRLLADVSLRGLGNISSVRQTGVRHVASVDVDGGGAGTDAVGRRRGNNVGIVQNDGTNGLRIYPQQINGAGHTARVQVGPISGGGVGTVTSVEQFGQHPTIGNEASVRHGGQYDRVSIFQVIRYQEDEGGAIANVATRGESGSVNLRQFGREFATVTQGFGRESTFTANQYDSAGSRGGGVGQFSGGRGGNSVVAAQYGDRNSVGITQEGTENKVSVWQKVASSNNSISVNQGANPGPGSNDMGETQLCGTRCQFTDRAVASVTQAGEFNRASTVQYSTSGRATIEQNGTGSSALPNIARIVQFFGSAEALILQASTVGASAAGDPSSGDPNDPGYFAGGARASEATIRQNNGLSARIEQRGRGQHAFIDQTGANTASIFQDIGATNATAIIVQGGSGNVYNVVQNQPGQYIHVSQTGTNNSVTNVISRP